jgi:succinate-semialdehyde dehydrogenase / glutarate-semialdehyde dehydrogenase
MLKSINPATEEEINSYQEMKWEEIEKIVSSADEAFLEWRRSSFSTRSSRIKRAAEVLRKKAEDEARLVSREMGKPIAQSRSEIEKCAWACDYFANQGEGFLQDQVIETDAARSLVTFQPLGLILAIMPWNFPYWQVFRFAVPALMAGNAVLLKHASNVCGCALAIEGIFREAGFPENLFRTILLSSDKIGRVLELHKTRAVTLTGNVTAGKMVASKAGSLIKKTVLELGGSDPYVVLGDADLEPTVEACVTSRLLNGGQSCIAAKRFIVVQERYADFRDYFVETMKKKKMGDPFDEANDLGPQALDSGRRHLHDQVRRSLEKGAGLLLGGEIPERKGAYYPPTVLENVKKGMPAYDEEVFGPVAALIKAEDETEAIRLANDSNFGLGAAVFTADLQKGERIAREELTAGNCFVNAFVKSDPRLPFGGVKESGFGRELSQTGLREFVNIKTVYIK